MTRIGCLDRLASRLVAAPRSFSFALATCLRKDHTDTRRRAQEARQGLQAAVLGQDSPVTFESGQKSKRLELGFPGGALHSCSESSAVEPGEGQMENVGL